jgi:hypothetical protein
VEHQTSGAAPNAESAAESNPETAAPHDPTWTFARAEDELTIVRQAAPQGCALIVVLNDSPKTYSFRDERSMVRFQADMETLLTHTGWSFVGFQPERRTRRDRRTMPRVNERRRWWTDGWLFSGK